MPDLLKNSTSFFKIQFFSKKKIYLNSIPFISIEHNSSLIRFRVICGNNASLSSNYGRERSSNSSLFFCPTGGMVALTKAKHRIALDFTN